MGTLRPYHVRRNRGGVGLGLSDSTCFSCAWGVPKLEWPELEAGAEGVEITEEVRGGRFLHKRRMRRSSKSRAMGMMVSNESDQTTRTRSSRWRGAKESRGGQRRERTYDECSILLLVGLRKEDHGVNDLNAGVCVDIDTVCLFVVGRLCESGMHSSASDFDGDQRVQGSDGSLEWLEGGDLVRKDAKRAIVSAETNTWRDGVFVWTKPSVTLGLLEDPVEGGIVSVVVHGGDSE